ncbi:MAG TPA: DUF262 domain-containing protein [Methanosarcinaceae archaeon]|nr:DUF262 domain-containing protein [Methanosarcinaceae archaeon]
MTHIDSNLEESNGEIISESQEFDEEEDKNLQNELTDLEEPFNPSQIDIQAAQSTLDTLIKRLSHEEIDLQPDFQREQNLWNPTFKSRLIESLLIRFPLPAFYFDASNDDKWQVVDGLQRLYTIKSFVVDKKMKLNKLEFLKQFNNKTFDDLPRNMQRRIYEAQVTMYLIKPGTPSNVKFSLFNRINTGGLRLKPQEIRHAISQGVNNGQASKFLKEITETDVFQKVGRVSGKRMLDKELVLRFMALKLTTYNDYKAPMISFLNNAMEQLGKAEPEELNSLRTDMLKALDLSYDIFGDDAFRKSLVEDNKSKVLNRALFEAVTVLFSEFSENDSLFLLKNKTDFVESFKQLFDDGDFYSSITVSTTDSANVVYRFTQISTVINRYIA